MAATAGANVVNVTIVGNEASYNGNNEHENETDEDGTDNGGSSSSPSPPSSRPPSPLNLESLIERVEVLTNANIRAQIPSPTPDPTRQAASSVSLPPKNLETETLVDEVNPLTRQDAARLRRGLPLTKYDAFVLYADPDQHYANEMLQKLEKYTEFNFEACKILSRK